MVVPSFVHYLEVLEGSDGDKLPGTPDIFLCFSLLSGYHCSVLFMNPYLPTLFCDSFLQKVGLLSISQLFTPALCCMTSIRMGEEK